MAEGSQDKRLQEWEMLLLDSRCHETELAGILSLREELETAYARVRATRCMRETLQASSRDTTRQLKEALAVGKMAAAGLRRAVKSRRRIR